MRTRLFVTALIGFSLFLCSAATAQTVKKTGATLTGIVLSVEGKPVPNAHVSCQSSGGLMPKNAYTDADGRYTITGLKQDSYDLRASSNGLHSDWQRNIPLHRGQTKSVDLRLLPSAAPADAGAAPTGNKP